MYYSLTFKVNNVEKNTWEDWQMIPSTPPMIPLPEPNTNYVDVPGRSGGPLDLSGVQFNKMTYKRMTGSWTFYREPDTKYTRMILYDALAKYFNGKPGRVVLEEEPGWYYVGRFTVGVPKTGTGPIQIQIGFDLRPVRYNVDTDVADTSYGDADVVPYHEGVIPGPGGGGFDIEYNETTSDLHVFNIEL